MSNETQVVSVFAVLFRVTGYKRRILERAQRRFPEHAEALARAFNAGLS
jgi:hypothetical protein